MKDYMTENDYHIITDKRLRVQEKKRERMRIKDAKKEKRLLRNLGKYQGKLEWKRKKAE